MNHYGNDTQLKDIIAERKRDVAEVLALRQGKLTGRIRTGFRAVPSSPTDVIPGDVEGDIVPDGVTVYWLMSNGVDLEWIELGSGGGGGSGDSFKTIAVATQPNVVADSATDTLTLVGSGVTITTNATTDTITFTVPEANSYFPVGY